MGDIIIVLLVFWVVGKLLKGRVWRFSVKAASKMINRPAKGWDKYGQKRLVQEA